MKIKKILNGKFGFRLKYEKDGIDKFSPHFPNKSDILDILSKWDIKIGDEITNGIIEDDILLSLFRKKDDLSFNQKVLVLSNKNYTEIEYFYIFRTYGDYEKILYKFCLDKISDLKKNLDRTHPYKEPEYIGYEESEIENLPPSLKDSAKILLDRYKSDLSFYKTSIKRYNFLKYIIEKLDSGYPNVRELEEVITEYLGIEIKIKLVDSID
jgi:hypothetical protein